MAHYQLYEPTGYVNIKSIMDDIGNPYLYIDGGRGTGKTFGAVKYWFEEGYTALFLRRTQEQADNVVNPKLSTFMPILEELNITAEFTKLSKKLYQLEWEGRVRGYTAALSTFATIRGFAAEAIDLIIYDEFIKQVEEKQMRGEYLAWTNLIESINRNRELKGKPPVKTICCANSNDLGNPIYMGMEVVSVIARRRKKKKNPVYIDRKRHFTLVDLPMTEIGKLKAKTTLYEFVGENSEMYKMAIGNEFIGDEIDAPRSRPLIEYRPICKWGEIVFYRHKNDKRYYATSHVSGSPMYYKPTWIDGQRFKAERRYIIDAYVSGRLEFEEYSLIVLFDKYLKVR